MKQGQRLTTDSGSRHTPSSVNSAHGAQPVEHQVHQGIPPAETADLRDGDKKAKMEAVKQLELLKEPQNAGPSKKKGKGSTTNKGRK